PCNRCNKTSTTFTHVEGRMDVPMRSFFPGKGALRHIWCQAFFLNPTSCRLPLTFEQTVEYYPFLVCLYSHLSIPTHSANNTLNCYSLNPDNTLEKSFLSSRSYRVTKIHIITLPDIPRTNIFQALKSYTRVAYDYARILLI